MEWDDPDSDWDADGGTNALAEESSQGTSEQSSPRRETPMESPAETPHNDMLAEAAMGLVSQDVVQLHAGDDDLE